ncbi:hypothetical protein SB767_35900, partial [Bacillus sp. SIMBA_069]
ADIKEYSSTTGTGYVNMTIKAKEGRGEQAKQDVQNAVNRLRNGFPKAVDTVNVSQMNFGDEQMIDYALVGADPQAMLS